MPLSIGIVGLPNVGKSTLFNTLTKKQAPAENYPFCTIEPNVGMVEVPDERLKILADISKPEKIIPTIIEFVDIAGLVQGASAGEGLGNKFLSHIRECDAIAQVVRAFKDDNVIHVANRINPVEDKEIINLELVLADLATVSKRLEKAEKDCKSGDKKAIIYKDLLIKIKNNLEQEIPVRDLNLTEEESLAIKDLALITAKPMLYIINVKDGQKLSPEFLNQFGPHTIELNIKTENEIVSLPADEQKEYLEALNMDSSGLDKLIKTSYGLLNLVSFFTTGTDETRAWTIKKDTKAPQAAAAIHTDFEKGFVRAEIIAYEDFRSCGSEIKAKELGLMRIEGKEYIVKDGDICHFLINR
ncbi:MAG: redox-regulated ATPase YchF [Patescibacteria group bacterium]|nr:redox-regulated ATPase YchF [Patescibacteria group bacterium]